VILREVPFTTDRRIDQKLSVVRRARQRLLVSICVEEGVSVFEDIVSLSVRGFEGLLGERRVYHG
jgi:hypothetical protein